MADWNFIVFALFSLSIHYLRDRQLFPFSTYYEYWAVYMHMYTPILHADLVFFRDKSGSKINESCNSFF